jgi:hypothetical protein
MDPASESIRDNPDATFPEILTEMVVFNTPG